ncbi:MAG: sensor domain-containing diguanylate cyclase [Actinobacteria bacterium]|nr:sensor domain-containing diguanylate cyclase [Actinomycetota bacterium]MBU1942789.1 sensor domain-containing diguanylate cyclase [Actinomycetota bacterium]MBU2686111.1 sensor domain-containing diguanylate cyclase [Actinomycetota bacterium]
MAIDETDLLRTALDLVSDGVYFLDRDRVITYWSRGAEEITGFSADEVTGRPCRDGIMVHVDDRGNSLCDSGMCPAAAVMSGAPFCESEVFFRHSDGHRVPVLARVSPLKGGGGEVLGSAQAFSDRSARVEAEEEIEELKRLTLLDELTGLGNRRNAQMHLESQLGQLKRYGWPFGVVYFDIDEFKAVNDRYGHAAGDSVLRVVSRTAAGGLRSFDSVHRWGGEEFLAVVINVGEPTLARIAEKIRALVESSAAWTEETRVGVTISVGATVATEDDDTERLVSRADALMYESKTAGRNRTTLG